MFKKQRFKFAILNTSVFFVLFILFNTVIYFYTKSSLYSGVDRSLLISKAMIVNTLSRNKTNIQTDTDSPQNSSAYTNAIQEFGRNRIFELDPRVIPIFRDSKGNILIDTHLPMFYQHYINNIKPTKIDELFNIKFNQFNFRTIAFSTNFNNKTIMVQLLRNTNSEIEHLHNLLKLILIGGIILFIVSAGSGIFLSHRAMIPIVSAWERQRQFVEDASHELRTPLAVVHSQLELILKQPDETVLSNANHLGIALSETRRLTKLVSDLLTLARSDSDTAELQIKPVNISDLIKRISEPYIELGAVEGKTVSLNLADNLITGCDESKIAQLIVILLDNAIKYTNTGGFIETSLIRDNNRYLIIVKDTGIGIKESERDLIFKRFYRGDKSRARATGGTGLGLSIAAWIVKKHGGSIKAMQNLPQGTIIKVILPIS